MANTYDLYSSHATCCLQKLKKHITCVLKIQLTWSFFGFSL
jgi:hypothetical protein